MGLDEGKPQHQPTAWLYGWLLPGIVVGAAALLVLLGDPGRIWLRYDRAAIAAGEIWRLFTGHFVHLGAAHFALDAAGLLLVWYLVSHRFTAAQWLQITLLTILGMDLGFWVLQPQLAWYVGLSGLLHGLFAAGIVPGLRERSPEAWFLAAMITAKIIYEQLVGPLPGSEASSGGAVIVAAHLYGALSGSVTAAWLCIRVRP